MAQVIDPVCGMQIESGEAAGQAMYNGVTYYFCSTDCRDRFMKSPEKFLSGKAD